MIQEKVLAVNDVFITTDSGKKTPLGNRIFDVGDLVWTDGNYAFGTKKNTNFPMQMAAAMPYTGKYFIWQGAINNPIFRIYNAETLEYMEIPGTIIGGRFIYNSKGTKFVWLMGSGNQVQIYILTATGYTNYTVTLPYSYNGVLNVDGYIDDAGDVYWSVFLNDFKYSRYYTTEGEVYNTTGHVVMIKYKNDGILNTYDYTATIKDKYDIVYEACSSLSNTSGLSLLYSNIVELTQEEKQAQIPNNAISAWHVACEYAFSLISDNYVPDGESYAINKPKANISGVNLIRYDDGLIFTSIWTSSNIYIEAIRGYHQADWHYNPIQYGSTYVSKASIASIIACGDSYIDKNLAINQVLNQQEISNVSLSCRHKQIQYNVSVAGEPAYVVPSGWQPGDYLPWPYHISATETIDIESQTPVDDMTYTIDSCDCGYGFTFEYHPVVGSESGTTPAYFLLKNANWSMDVSTMVDNFTKFETPPQVTPLDDERILFLNCPNNALYMINIADNSKQLLSKHYTDNGRIPLITGQTAAELIRILTKVPS